MSRVPGEGGRLLPVLDGEEPSFSALDIAAHYRFPAQFDGTGTTIATVSLYGGFRRSDLDTYFSALGLGTPQIDVIPVGGARNNPVADPEANGPLVLTLEILGSIAPGARLAVYFAGNHELGLVDGLSAAIYGQELKADVLCLPWTIEEADIGPMVAGVIDDRMKAAALLGLPVCATAGSWDGEVLRPAVPGSHPMVLACGATGATRQGAGLVEQAAAGGWAPSASTLWPRPDWQAKAAGKASVDVPGRLVPDVSALADPQIGYSGYVNGQWASMASVIIAPCLWAGLLARLHQALGRPWGMVSDLYSRLGPAGVLTAVPALAQEAGPGPAADTPAWNSSVGWGTPDGTRLLAALSSAT